MSGNIKLPVFAMDNHRGMYHFIYLLIFMHFYVNYFAESHAAAHPLNVYIYPLQECSESCGGGQQRSTRVVEQQPSGGGEECGELGTWSLIMH